MTRKRPLSTGILLFVGLLMGAGATLAALRATRTPDNPFYDLRVRILPLPFADDQESKWLAATYGPERFSEGIEEWIIRDFFQDKRGGTFLDVGSADYKTLSNTYYLENRLGWTGIAVDALERYREGYRLHRPGTKFFTFFVSDKSSTNATLFVGKQTFVSSSERAFTERFGAVTETVQVPTITLDDLLEAQGVSRIDFLSLDIELHEPQALAGFDIGRFKPTLLCVESHPEVRQDLLDYFSARDYVVASKYLRVDRQNLWFMPAGTPVKPFPFTADLH